MVVQFVSVLPYPLLYFAVLVLFVVVAIVYIYLCVSIYESFNVYVNVVIVNLIFMLNYRRKDNLYLGLNILHTYLPNVSICVYVQCEYS